MHKKSRRHAQVWLAAALALSAQTATTLHTLFVQHTRCIEHGDLVDAAPQEAHFHLHDDRAPQVIATKDTAVHEHDHCIIAMLERQRLSAKTIDVAIASPPCTNIQASPIEVAFISPARLLSLAPKHSPPSV